MPTAIPDIRVAVIDPLRLRAEALSQYLLGIDDFLLVDRDAPCDVLVLGTEDEADFVIETGARPPSLRQSRDLRPAQQRW